MPLLFGVGMVFFDGRSLLGFFLLFTGVVIIAVDIFANLAIYFQPISLFDILMMLGMTAGGIGLMLRPDTG